jgi:hypothetical protein
MTVLFLLLALVLGAFVLRQIMTGQSLKWDSNGERISRKTHPTWFWVECLAALLGACALVVAAIIFAQ